MRFLLGILLSVYLANAEHTTIRLLKNGGHCLVCGEDYACSNGVGMWNDGINIFTNPVPVGNFITNITLEIQGVFLCQSPFTQLDLMIQDNYLGTAQGTGDCACGGCNTPMFIKWDSQGSCLENYNYSPNGLNQLKLVITQGLPCISYMDLTFYYEPDTENNNCSVLMPECSTFGGCNSGTCYLDQNLKSKCKCPTDYSGPNCQCYIDSYHLETDLQPFLNLLKSGFNIKDTLHLAVEISSKYYDTQITYKNSLNSVCDFQTPSQGVYYTETFDPITCRNTIMAVIPWGIAWPTCIFSRTEDSEYIIFTGEMLVKYKEDLGNLSDIRLVPLTRNMENRLPFVIKYPKNVNIQSTDIIIYSNITVQASILEQKFDSSVQLPGRAQIRLLTSVQFPFMIIPDNSVFGSSSNLFNVEWNPLGSGQYRCDDNGKMCNQLWAITINPNIQQCNFNDNYFFNMIFGCQPSRSQACPIDDNTMYASLTFTLDSGNFCSQIVETIDAIGTMSTYKDSSYTVPKGDFLNGQTAYFKTFVSSSEASITETNIEDINLLLAGNIVKPLYGHGVHTTDGTVVNLIVSTDSTDGSNTFSLQIHDIVFELDPDEIISASLEVNVLIQYYNTAPVKRTLTSATNYKIQDSVTVSYSYEESIGVISSIPSIITLICLGLLLVN